MKVELSNVSKKDIYIWASDLCWNPAKGLSMHMTSADGSQARGDVLLDCVPPPPRSGGLNTLIRIQPGQSYSRTDTFKVRDLINMPGEFDIRITFRSFLSREFIEEFLSKEPIATVPVWTMEEPPLAAPKIHVVIAD